MNPTEKQLELIRDRISAAKSREGSLYSKKYADIDESTVTSAEAFRALPFLSLIHISEPTRLLRISYAVIC